MAAYDPDAETWRRLDPAQSLRTMRAVREGNVAVNPLRPDEAPGAIRRLGAYRAREEDRDDR